LPLVFWHHQTKKFPDAAVLQPVTRSGRFNGELVSKKSRARETTAPGALRV
jgi:hypothetical protein